MARVAESGLQLPPSAGPPIARVQIQIGGKDGGGDAGKVKDLKQLSGGERSFTTVAFTLALGALTDMPFRVRCACCLCWLWGRAGDLQLYAGPNTAAEACGERMRRVEASCLHVSAGQRRV